MVVVTINTSARHPPFLDTPLKVKRLVLSLPGELVCCAVLRRPRSRYGVCMVAKRRGLCYGSHEWHFDQEEEIICKVWRLRLAFRSGRGDYLSNIIQQIPATRASRLKIMVFQHRREDQRKKSKDVPPAVIEFSATPCPA